MEPIPNDKNDSDLQSEILNQIFINKRYIYDIYTINELKRLISIGNYNFSTVNLYLENFTKEENLKRIENQNYTKINNKTQSNNNTTVVKQKKLTYYLISKSDISIKNLNPKKIQNLHLHWEFLNMGINLIDLKDALTSIDKVKIIEKIKKEKASSRKNIDPANLNLIYTKELNKKLEEKERKYIHLYQNSFEENDILYLTQIQSHFNPNPNKTLQLPSTTILFTLLLTMPKNLIYYILSYVDIFTLGKIGLCSKKLYSLLYKNNQFEYISKLYITSIFINSQLYEINSTAIKSQYKSTFDIFKNKSRIRFGGVYYAKVKLIKEVYNYGEEYNKAMVVNYYRILRFIPNGDVYSMTTPFFKNRKIKSAIKSGLIELKKGVFKIDDNNRIIILMENTDEYIYKFGWSEIGRYRSGYSKNDIGVLQGFELVSFSTIRKIDNKEEKTEIFVSENFPKRFRFRSIELLKKDIQIHSVYE